MTMRGFLFALSLSLIRYKAKEFHEHEIRYTRNRNSIKGEKIPQKNWHFSSSLCAMCIWNNKNWSDRDDWLPGTRTRRQLSSPTLITTTSHFLRNALLLSNDHFKHIHSSSLVYYFISIILSCCCCCCYRLLLFLFYVRKRVFSILCRYIYMFYYTILISNSMCLTYS